MNPLLIVGLILQGNAPEETLKQFETTVLSAKSLCVKFKITVAENGKTQLTGSGTLLMREGNRLNYTIQTLENELHDKEYRFVSNGERIKASYHRKDRDPSREREQATPGDLAANFVAGLCRAGIGGPLSYDAVRAFLGDSGPDSKIVPLRWKSTLVVTDLRQGDVVGEGLKVINYRLHFTGDASSPAAEARMWIDPKTCLPTKRTFTFAEYVVTETYEAFTLNGEISDEKFRIPDRK